MMKWNIEYAKQARRDLRRLAPYNCRFILKAINRTVECPLPPPRGGEAIGKSLWLQIERSTSWRQTVKLCGPS